LLDAVTTIQRAGCDARIICPGRAAQAILERIVGGRALVRCQAGLGLGAGLESAFRDGLAAGFSTVAVLGADTPTLPPDFVGEAFAALEAGCDVALGPCADGGYYLLAARALQPQLFRDMTWSTSSVAQVTLGRCAAAGLRTRILPAWYDVDDADSLAQLQLELGRVGSSCARATRMVLAQIAGRPDRLMRAQQDWLERGVVA
jgi:glycosyltransferase A (GT-A) superfamily protein (DUF2064 family)